MDHLFSTSTGLNKWGSAFGKTVEYKSDIKNNSGGSGYGRYSLYLDNSTQPYSIAVPSSSFG